MSAQLYIVTVVFDNATGAIADWRPILASAANFINSTLGGLEQGILLNAEDNVQKQFDFADREQFASLHPNDLLTFYPAHNRGCVGFEASANVLSMKLCVDFSALSEEMSKLLMIDLWQAILPLGPSFAVAGDDFSPDEDELNDVLSGKMPPLDIMYCHSAISTVQQAPSEKAEEAGFINGGFFEKWVGLFDEEEEETARIKTDS